MKKRIVSVEDEPNILKGMLRMLECQSGVWDMVFVGSGEVVVPFGCA